MSRMVTGPSEQAVAAMLGRAGRRVVVFEQFAEIHLPGEVHLDHEIMRLLQSLGVRWPRG